MLVRGLSVAAANQRNRAQAATDWLRVYLPVLATVVIGGGVMLAFVWTVLIPWWDVLHFLTQPPQMVL